MFCKLNEQPYFEKPDPVGGGGAGGGKDDADREKVRAEIRAELEQEYAGLKANRDEVLAEKRAMKEKLASVEAIISAAGGSDGIKALQELKTRLEKDEIGRLLTEGKHEEWFERRTARQRSEYEQQLKKAVDELELERNLRFGAEKARTDLMLETEVRAAAAKLGVVESAVSDAILRARGEFSYDQERDSLIIKDENEGAVLGKDGKKPMTIEEWLEGQKDKARHWFPPSKGAGAAGSHGGVPGSEDPSKMDWNEYAEWRKRQGLGRVQGIPG